MSMTIELRISGLSMFYRRGQFWQVVFVCDSMHPADFKYGDQTDYTPLYKSDTDRFISIYPDNAVAPASPTGEGFDKILNMAGPLMHGPNVLEIKGSGAKKIVCMNIPAASLSVEAETDDDYYVIDLNENFHNIGPVAKTVVATITLNQGNGMTMVISDSSVSEVLLEVPYAEGTTYPIEFYNDCNEIYKSSNDFLLYYDWVIDSTGADKKCLAGHINGHLADKMIEAESNEKKLTASEGMHVMSEKNGNCDPVAIYPQPGP